MLRPTEYSALNPKRSAAAVSTDWSTGAVDVIIAVLHDSANAWENGMRPSSPPSKLRNERPPALVVASHCTGVSGVMPSASRASAVTTLNVEPGG